MYDDHGVQKKELKIDNQPTDITKVNDLTVAVATSTRNVYLVDPKLLTLSRIFTGVSDRAEIRKWNNPYTFTIRCQLMNVF
jgi:hypothetical protein